MSKNERLIRVYQTKHITYKDIENRMSYLGLNSLTAYVNWLISNDINKFEDKGEK